MIEIPQTYYKESGDEVDLPAQSQQLRYQFSDGKIVGTHQGAYFFTIGQRKGLAVGGTPDPLFVIDTDVEENIVYVGQGKNHAGLLRKALKVNIEDVHWVRDDLKIPEGETMEVMARIRYRQPLQKAIIYPKVDAFYVLFEEPQSAITPGQFVAWYQEEELLGSGIIV
ncbi:MAG: hypothetical protein CMC93_04085 [Flavobacteriaceae bacterium]|nr:hypothetical protein [Flavobacteriaceae bacterium]